MPQDRAITVAAQNHGFAASYFPAQKCLTNAFVFS